MAYWNKLRENKGPAQTRNCFFSLQALPARDLNGEQNDMFIHSRVVESTSSIDFTSCTPPNTCMCFCMRQLQPMPRIQTHKTNTISLPKAETQINEIETPQKRNPKKMLFVFTQLQAHQPHSPRLRGFFTHLSRPPPSPWSCKFL